MTVRILVSGYVQGVGFRQFLKHNATKLNVVGWVRNLPDGRVEAILEGEEEKVKKMIDLCHKGPFLASVKNVEVENLSEQLFKSFDII
jgi:acylphosphatase